MTGALQPTLQPSGIEWPALRNHIPYLAHDIQLVLGAFMSSLGVKGLIQSRETHQRNQQCGENQTTENGRSQRFRKEGNARFDQVSAMRLGLAKIIEKLHIWSNVDSPEIAINIGANPGFNDYTETCPSKQVDWLSKSQSENPSTANYGCEETVESDTGVAWVSLPITRIHPQVAYASKIRWLPVTLYNTG